MFSIYSGSLAVRRHFVHCGLVLGSPSMLFMLVFGSASMRPFSLHWHASQSTVTFAECALRGVYSKGVKTLTIFGQNIRPHILSKLGQNHSFSYIKGSPWSWGTSPKTQGCLLYKKSHEVDASLTRFGAGDFGQTSSKF